MISITWRSAKLREGKRKRRGNNEDAICKHIVLLCFGWLDVSVTRRRSAFGFVLMSGAVKFALSQTSQCTRIMQCISVTVIRSLVVIQVILLHLGHPQFQQTAAKQTRVQDRCIICGHSAVQLSNSFSLQRQCLECSATQLLLPTHGGTACCWCLREWWQMAAASP